jgi:hypothetical protein
MIPLIHVKVPRSTVRKRFRCILLFFAVAIGGDVGAQSFENMPETRKGKNPFVHFNWELDIRRVQLSSKYVASVGGTTVNAKFRADAFEKGDWRYYFENPTLGDLFWMIGHDKKTSNSTEKGVLSFGSGFLGWHQIYWNVVAQDKLLVSPGISLGDYIFGTQRPQSTDNSSGKTLDPAGYYFHAGPAIMVTKLLTETLWVNAYTRYDLTTRAGKLDAGTYVETPGYKKPHFFALGASVQHGKSHLCGAINYTHMIDRGGNKDAASRIDVTIGFMF